MTHSARFGSASALVQSLGAPIDASDLARLRRARALLDAARTVTDGSGDRWRIVAVWYDPGICCDVVTLRRVATGEVWLIRDTDFQRMCCS